MQQIVSPVIVSNRFIQQLHVYLNLGLARPLRRIRHLTAAKPVGSGPSEWSPCGLVKTVAFVALRSTSHHY